MYEITFNPTTGIYNVSCEIQDGTERWTTKDRGEAFSSLVSAARTLNGSYITKDDIRFTIRQNDKVVNSSDVDLLDRIRRNELVVLSRDDKRIKYRITDAECESILALRENPRSY